MGVEFAKIHPLLGWNDGMVIGNLQILDKTLLVDPEPFLDKTVTQGLEGCILQTAQPVRQRCDDIGGDVAAVGSWVGDDLVLLIEGLQYIQGLFGDEIKQVVCIPLQLGEVIGKRRLFALSTVSRLTTLPDLPTSEVSRCFAVASSVIRIESSVG